MRRRGFTLIEILLVLAIIAVVTAITVPNLVRSIRGNRLRFAARQAVMANRYARSMAVMKQRDMAITYDLDRGVLTIHSADFAPAPRKPDEDEDRDADGNVGEYAFGLEEDEEQESARRMAARRGSAEISRTLDRVRFVYIEIGDSEERFDKGSHTILYRQNGRCTSHRLQVADDWDSRVSVEIDALGSVTTERGS